ncbi:ATP synthase, delta/Epsilon chain, beta-sandwich domain-containing protein [Ditylenchus destructor]|uniref:F-ATPase delta subunit n=1 Tax=Ditylenchus destructor TaxID=166010 RepID=A0AAD4NHW6_9BILA|nr:ATP synthase, delta/Epsilon chain, beta-sandwich domain-containing protein [Ditylenchus destructor]
MLVSALRSVARIVPKRFYAAAATEAARTAETGELRLTLAAPDRAFYNGIVVKQVDVPTVAGAVGILPNHVPVIGVLKPGVVQVYDIEGNITKYFVSSGTLSMNIDGSVQVLAEEVLTIDEIDESAARRHLEAAQRKSVEAGTEVEKAEASIRVDVCDALIKAATGQL